MADAPAVGVCGFGRCGSTLVMHMLVAGGLPAVAAAMPGSYETSDEVGLVGSLPDLAGHCVKLLDQVLYDDEPPLPKIPWRFIWLDRDPRQQARSMLKLAKGAGIPMGRTQSSLVRGFGPDRARALKILRDLGPVEVLRFESLLADPVKGAALLADFVGLDVHALGAMAAVVHERDPRCLPDLATENEIIRTSAG